MAGPLRPMSSEGKTTSHKLHYDHGLTDLICYLNDAAFDAHIQRRLLVLKLQPVGVSGLDVKAYNYLQHPDLCAAFQKIVEHRYWMTLFHGMETPSSLHCHQCNIQSELIDGYDRYRSKMSRRVGYDMHYPHQLALAHFDSILHLTLVLVD